MMCLLRQKLTDVNGMLDVRNTSETHKQSESTSILLL